MDEGNDVLLTELADDTRVEGDADRRSPRVSHGAGDLGLDRKQLGPLRDPLVSIGELFPRQGAAHRAGGQYRTFPSSRRRSTAPPRPRPRRPPSRALAVAAAAGDAVTAGDACLACSARRAWRRRAGSPAGGRWRGDWDAARGGGSSEVIQRHDVRPARKPAAATAAISSSRASAHGHWAGVGSKRPEPGGSGGADQVRPGPGAQPWKRATRTSRGGARPGRHALFRSSCGPLWECGTRRRGAPQRMPRSPHEP